MTPYHGVEMVWHYLLCQYLYRGVDSLDAVELTVYGIAQIAGLHYRRVSLRCWVGQPFQMPEHPLPVYNDKGEEINSLTREQFRFVFPSECHCVV